MQITDRALTFDDILLVPKFSTTKHRAEIDLEMPLDSKRSLQLPVIASPMDTVASEELITAITKIGGLGVVHRFDDISKRMAMVRRLRKEFPGIPLGAAVGSASGSFTDAMALIDAGATIILVDVAHGHHISTANIVSKIKERYTNTHVMAGNVATAEGFRFLQNHGADSVRVGVGGGSVCTTRVVTGHGLPTLASLLRIQEIPDKTAKVVADGGIRNTGDMVKAYAAGADFVMLGSMLAGTDEAPGEVIDGRKVYRGMASAEAQEDWRGKVSVAEGVATTVECKGPVLDVLRNIRAGVQSGCSYSGVSKLSELAALAEAVPVTFNGIRESVPHSKVKL